jgi:hypothetical protein
MFGIRDDEKVERIFQSSSIIYDDFAISPHAKSIRGVSRLCRMMMKVRSVQDLRGAVEPIQSTLLPLLRDFERCYGVNPKFSTVLPDDQFAFRQASLVSLDQTYQDIKQVKIVYSETFGKSKNPWAQWTILPESIPKSQEFFQGYKLAVGYLWYMFLGESAFEQPSLCGMLRTRTWKGYGRYFRRVQRDIVTPLEKKTVDTFFGGEIFTQRLQPPSRLARRLTNLPPVSSQEEQSNEELLDQAFLGFPVRIINHYLTIPSTEGFRVALHGTVSRTRGKIRVLRFLHGNSLSYAILVRGRSNMVDYSTWWLFLDFCGNESPLHGQGYRQVESDLKQFSGRVLVEDHQVEGMVLRDYAENHSEMAQFEVYEPDFDRSKLPSLMNRRFSPSLRSQLSSAKDEISSLKGRALELLVYGILARQGYAVSLRYTNSKVLGDDEVDLLASREGQKRSEIIVVECTASFDAGLLQELNEKVAKIRNSVLTVSRELHWRTDESTPVSGIIVTTDAVDKSLKRQGQSEIWDRDRLISECKRFELKPSQVGEIYPVRNEPKVVRIKSMKGLARLWRSIKHEDDS